MGGPHILGIAAPANLYTPSKPTRDAQYLKLIRMLPCLVCCTRRQVEAAHTGPHGIGQKSSDLSALPLCHAHHRTAPDSLHRLGPVAFQQAHGVRFAFYIRKFNRFYFHNIRRAPVAYYGDYWTFALDLPECFECGKPFPAESLTPVPGEDPRMKFCPACATDMLASQEADQLGSCAIAVICEAKHVGEMTALLKAHIAQCARCGQSRRKDATSERIAPGREEGAA